MTTGEPAGKTTPFEAVTACAVCATILSPGRFASEHARESSVSPTVVPAAMTPAAGAGAGVGAGAGTGVSTIGAGSGVGGGGVTGFGCVRAGARTVVGVRFGSGFGSGFSTTGVESGVSRSCGVGVATALASVMSRDSAESAEVASSRDLSRHAATARNVVASTNAERRLYGYTGVGLNRVVRSIKRWFALEYAQARHGDSYTSRAPRIPPLAVTSQLRQAIRTLTSAVSIAAERTTRSVRGSRQHSAA